MFLSNPKSEVTTYSFKVHYPSGLKCDLCQNKHFELSLWATAGNGNCARVQRGLTYKFCLQTNKALMHGFVCLYAATKPSIEKQAWLKQFVLCPRGPRGISTFCSHVRSHPRASWPRFELHQAAVIDTEQALVAVAVGSQIGAASDCLHAFGDCVDVFVRVKLKRKRQGI